jgi:hypothetical protein
MFEVRHVRPNYRVLMIIPMGVAHPDKFAFSGGKASLLQAKTLPEQAEVILKRSASFRARRSSEERHVRPDLGPKWEVREVRYLWADDRVLLIIPNAV